MRLEDELTALRTRIDELARGPATIHEWQRADLRARTALLEAACCHAYAQLEQLLLIRMCIESRIFELEADHGVAQ